MAKRLVTQLKESRKFCPKNSTTCAIGVHTQPKCEMSSLSPLQQALSSTNTAVSKPCEKSIIGHHQMVTIFKDYDRDYPDLHAHTFYHLTVYLELHLPNVVSHDDATKAHDLSTQIRDRPGDDILLNMNAAQVTAYLALQDEAKKLRKNRSNRNTKSKRQNRKSEDDTTSDDESDRPKKKAALRPEVYCWCHGIQKTHSSSECKVMAADPAQFTPAMRNATKSTSPPGGSTRMYGRRE